LPAAFAQEGDALMLGRIYVAPHDSHLLVAGNRLVLAHGPRENGFRPAIDPLFRTAARERGPSVIGVILSGALSDGTYGLGMIKHHGGLAIVQQPEDALIASMPESAIRNVDVDHIVPAAEIGPLIARLSTQAAGGKHRSDMARSDTLEPQLRSQSTEVREMQRIFGPPSGLTCPDCGGALWEVQEGRLVRYQCHVGHQYAAENLEAGQRELIDSALWSAVRVLEEHAELKARMARRAADNGMPVVSEGFAEGAEDALEQAQRIRGVLLESGAEETGGAGERAVAAARSPRAAPSAPARKSSAATAAHAAKRPRRRKP
jgi:two-component system chemotaxis response regulator CheB